MLYLQDPVRGQYFGSMGVINDGGTRSYNAMVLSVQRRRAKGVTIQGNYTWSHCIDDGYSDTIQQAGNTLDRRNLFRANCELDRRHNFNMSTVYETPQFANSTLRMVVGGWRISGILRMLGGSQLQASTGVTPELGIAPNTTDEVPRQILGSVYADDKTVARYLNAAAFQAPVQGAYGPLIHVQNFAGPGSIRIDLGLVRTFNVTEGKTLEFRCRGVQRAKPHESG